MPPAPRSRGRSPDGCEADATVAEGRPGLPTPRVSAARRQAPAPRQAVAKVSRLPNLVLVPSVSVAGLQFKHGREHARPSPCRAAPPLAVPPRHCLRRHLQKPGLLFIKLLQSEAFTLWPQDASVKAKPQPGGTGVFESYWSVKGRFA